MHFCNFLSGRFDMLVSMSGKELKRLSVLQEICDQRITQSQAAQLLHISECQVRRILQKYKAQGPVVLTHAGRGRTSNSKLPEELRLKCLNMTGSKDALLNAVCWCLSMMLQENCSIYASVSQNQPLTI